MTFTGATRGASANTIVWMQWSATETKRLMELDADELIIAIKTRNLDDLTEADQDRVLTYLGSKGGHKAVDEATAIYTAGRVPASVKGKGLPCGPSHRPRRLSIAVGLIALAVIGWSASLIVGHDWISKHNKEIDFAP